MPHLAEQAPALIPRVRRIAGQVGALERALLADAPCADVLQLAAAIRGAVGGLLDEIVAAHLDAHVARPGLSDDERAAGAAEVLAAIRRYVQ